MGWKVTDPGVQSNVVVVVVVVIIGQRDLGRLGGVGLKVTSR